MKKKMNEMGKNRVKERNVVPKALLMFPLLHWLHEAMKV